MAIQKKIPIARAVEMAMYNIGIEDKNRYVPLFKVWGKEAEEKIGSYTQYKRKIEVLDVHECRAKLPDCAVAVIGMMLGDHGCDCGLLFSNVYSYQNTGSFKISPTSGFTLVDITSGGPCNTNISYNIQNNGIVFKNNFDGRKVTVDLLVWETDCDGFIMINENHIDAIAQYIELRWMEREKHRKGTVAYTAGEMQRMNSEWHRKCANARAEDGEPSLSDRAEIAAMINDPLTGIGNAYWIVNNTYSIF